jgi:glycosyltransferase involved in cell wall biosynthesis
MSYDPARPDWAETICERLIIHAPNVHSGGGAALLTSLLDARQNARELVLLCDSRLVIDPFLQARITMHRFEPRIAARLAAERKLREIATKEDVVLAFGNLPPVYRLKAETVLFLQNRYLVDPSMSLNGFNLRPRLRLTLERIWVRRRLANADRIVVQTSTMADHVKRAFGRTAKVIPLQPTQAAAQTHNPGRQSQEKNYDFVYVSSGEPHKNHAVLLDAWALLADAGVMPSLALTLSPEMDGKLIARIADLNRIKGTKITNLGWLRVTEVAEAYASSGALIFPSLSESFGLPLIEAAELGLPILASELDFVRDLVIPVESFDPRSPRSIARAVQRALHLPTDVHTRVGAGDFLKHVYEEQL